MIELLLVFILGTTSVPAPEPVRCVVVDVSTGTCTLWYDPATDKFYDSDGNETKAPWQS